MAYDPSIIAAIKREAAKVSDPSKRNRYLRAALQTGIVESGLRNLNYGDADSLGWRQERTSLYKNPTNVAASVHRFFQEAAQLDRGQPSWQLAADVQRPAAQYRGRYKDVAAQAAKLLGGGVQATGEEQPSGTLEPVGSDGQAAQALQLLAPTRPKLQITAPTAPVFAARPTAAAPGQQQLPPSAPPEAKPERLDMGKALEAIAALRRPPEAEITNASGAGSVSPSRDSSPAPGGNGKFTISGPHPDRLQKSLVQFAGKVADIFGGTLGGLDGSSHSKYTVNGNVSQHYTGNATDIFTINGKPATGKRLIAAGRAALIAAGMDPAKARKAPGGLYNVGGHQIIFGVNGTQYGGNHLDHLHISAR